MSKVLFVYSIKEIKAMLNDALVIDDSSDYALDTCIKEHSRKHGEWVALAAKAQKMLRMEELELKKTTAETISKIRGNAVEEGTPLPKTYPVEKELVPLDADWQKAAKKVIELNEYVDILSAVERSWNNRAWLLIRLAKNRDGVVDPVVKGQQREDSTAIELAEYEL